MPCGGGSSNADAMQALQNQQQQAIQQGTQQVNQIFSQFNPAFYQGRAQAYENYAMPQLQQQFGQEKNNLSYDLYNRGLQDSSAGRGLGNSLANEMTVQTQNIANQGNQQALDLQRTLTGEQANVLNQLQTSANPSQAAQQALAYASQAQAPSALQPLGQAFGNWANIYLSGQQNNMANSYVNQMQYNPALYQALGYGSSGGNQLQ